MAGEARDLVVWKMERQSQGLSGEAEKRRVYGFFREELSSGWSGGGSR